MEVGSAHPAWHKDGAQQRQCPPPCPLSSFSTHHLFIHPLTYSFIHSFIHLPIHHPLIHPFTHPSIHSSIYPSIHSFIIYPSIHSFIHLPTHPLIHPCAHHPSIHPTIHSFIHSSRNKPGNKAASRGVITALMGGVCVFASVCVHVCVSGGGRQEECTDKEVEGDVTTCSHSSISPTSTSMSTPEPSRVKPRARRGLQA